MKTAICCKNPTRGQLAFYLVQNQKEYFLFYQPYRSKVAEYYMHGQALDDALDFSKGRNDTCILKTMSKLPAYIRYLEKEYGLAVLRQTKQAAEKPNKKTVGSRADKCA